MGATGGIPVLGLRSLSTVEPHQRRAIGVTRRGSAATAVERIVDLLPTRAGKPKAEENLSKTAKARIEEYEKSGDEEAVDAKAMDAAPANMMVNSPSKKK
jgi:hypothetical protein